MRMRPSSISSIHTNPYFSRCELDSHADTCCFGSNCYLVAKSNRTVDVTGFISDLGTVNEVSIASCAVAFDDPSTYSTVVIIFHQSLYFGDRLQNHLICPNQLRMNGVVVYLAFNA